jgi:hypothetical protein
MAKDILLDENNDLKLQNSDFDFGQSEMQDVKLILTFNQGALKSDPIVGANLFDMMKSKLDPTTVEKRVKIQLERDGKSYDNIKKRITYEIGNGRQ